jgi:radical SAM superfamily enzyme YgiQ (UPF0313 family)
MKILMVYPQNPDTFWSFKHVLRFVSKRSTFPPLGLLTVAAMLPADWAIKLIDLNVEHLKESDLCWADYVMISAMIVHTESVNEIVARCSALHRPIIAGGPLFTTGHRNFPSIQHFVLGEAEDLIPESLQECHKLHNQGRDLVESVKTLQRAGMEVMGGFIVGFDSDQQDIFKRQFDFIQRSGVVTAMVGLLQALPQTRLYHRLLREGRLETAATGNNTEAVLNFKTKLNREFLQTGYRDLMKRLYEPKVYYQRIRTFLDQHRPRGPRVRLSPADLRAFLKSFWLLGIAERGRHNYWRFFWSTVIRHPHQLRCAIELAVIGCHFRRVASRL